MAKRTLSVSGTFILQHLQLEDMRPKEDFRPGCKVDCIDRPRLHDGTLIRIDCDNRLGLVEWGTGHTGWWYLKDLVIVGWLISKEFREINNHEKHEIYEKIEQKNKQLYLIKSVQAGQ